MAKPITATPPVTGDDAERLQAELRNVCTPEETKRRIALAEKRLEATLATHQQVFAFEGTNVTTSSFGVLGWLSLKGTFCQLEVPIKVAERCQGKTFRVLVVVDDE
jgi:hypothetical protein